MPSSIPSEVRDTSLNEWLTPDGIFELAFVEKESRTRKARFWRAFYKCKHPNIEAAYDYVDGETASEAYNNAVSALIANRLLK